MIFDLKLALCYRQIEFRKSWRILILPLVYQFVVGGILFFIGFFLSWRSGDYSIKRKNDRTVSIYMISGILLYLVLQIVWHLLAQQK